MNAVGAPPLAWNLEAVARICSGKIFGDSATKVERVVTDSREARPGSLFVALRGDANDGHDFVDRALAAGAVAAMVEDSAAVTAAPRVEVGNTLDALLALAVQHRSELDAKVIAVTGSTGKTSTKDMLAAALGSEASTSVRSFNNDVGVPLTVLAAPRGARYLVAEVGSRGVGHISRLVPAVCPDVAIITNIGVVHLETMGSPDRVVQAKWELVEAVSETGVAVLPDDDARLHRPHRGRTVLFGSTGRADVGISGIEIGPDGTASFDLSSPAGSARVILAMAGARQPWNAAAATAAGLAVGRPFADIVAGLERASGSAWRMEVHRGRFTVVNDAYNANPDSMEAALHTVAAMPGRRVAVLGLMAELGSVSRSEHLRIGSLAAELGFDPVVVVGEEPGLAEGAGGAAQVVANPDAALALTLDAVAAGGVVLVKASRVAGLESLAAALVTEAQQ